MTNTPRWVATVLAITTALALAGGCGTSQPAGVNEDGVNGGLQQTNGRCPNDGATSECGIEIARSGGVITCAKGTRVCRGGVWGTCEASTTSAAHYDVSAPPPSTASTDSLKSGTVKGLTISATATTCTDNPCDPYCKKFPDVPDAALTGDSAITYPDKNLTFNDLPSGNPPDGFVKKGNDNAGTCAACYPAGVPGTPYAGAQACYEACQFDSHCSGNGASGCTMFTDGQKNACTGIDITSPLVCQIPDGATNGGKRKLAICNRGSADVPANSQIVCWTFPGGQPQYPNNNPLDSATNSAGPVDTFNEAVKAGQCITHVLDEAVFGNSGTVSVMCNVRQSYTSVVWVPSQGALPGAGRFPTTTISPGNWTNDTGVRDLGVSSASLSLGSTTVSAGSTTPAAVGGWTNLSNIGQTANASSASVLVGKGPYTSALTAGTASATVGAWVSPTNAQGAANATVAHVDLSATTTTAAVATATGATNDPAFGGSWTNIANANSSVDGSAVAVGTIPTRSGANNGTIGMFMAGPSIAGSNTVTNVVVTINRSTNDTANVSSRVDLRTAAGTTLIATPATGGLGSPLAALSTRTFTWTSADLAGSNLTLSDVSNAKFIEVYAENKDNGATHTLSVDYVTVVVTYQNAGNTGTLRFTNFGLNIPSAATINSVTVKAVAGAGGTAGAQGSYVMNVYKGGQATLVGTSGTTVQTAPTALATLTYVPAGLTGADLTDANFAVDLTATASTAATFTANVDAMTVTVNYDAPDTASTVTLNGFGLGALVPAGSSIEKIVTSVGLAVSAVNGAKNNMGALTKIGATTIGTVAVNPTTAVTQYTSTFTNSAGTYTQADLANLSVVLNADTTANVGFTGYVDNASVTVTYSTGLSSTISVGGFGFVVPVGSTDISMNVQSKWASTDSNTQLCFQLYDTSTGADVGTAHCSTAGATPSSLTTLESDGFGVTQVNAVNAAVKVTATRPAGAAASTSTLDYVVVQLKYTTPPTLTGVDECNINNNWTVSKKNPPLYCPAVTTYYDFTTTRVFDAICPAGTHSRWRLFGWDSLDPGASKIDFRFRSFAPTNGVCVALPAVTTSPPNVLATAASAPTDTQVCSLTAAPTASCPGDLTTYLGAPQGSDQECLQMDAYGTADPLVAAPSLNNWTATYDCLPTE